MLSNQPVLEAKNSEHSSARRPARGRPQIGADDMLDRPPPYYHPTLLSTTRTNTLAGLKRQGRQQPTNLHHGPRKILYLLGLFYNKDGLGRRDKGSSHQTARGGGGNNGTRTGMVASFAILFLPCFFALSLCVCVFALLLFVWYYRRLLLLPQREEPRQARTTCLLLFSHLSPVEQTPYLTLWK